jgi:hypothetical protein
MDRIEGLHTCDEMDELVPLFRRLAANPALPDGLSMRAQVHPWIYHDERPYRERLAKLVADIGAREGVRDERTAVAAPARTA